MDDKVEECKNNTVKDGVQGWCVKDTGENKAEEIHCEMGGKFFFLLIDFYSSTSCKPSSYCFIFYTFFFFKFVLFCAFS